jgi:hypothetical protein
MVVAVPGVRAGAVVAAVAGLLGGHRLGLPRMAVGDLGVQQRRAGAQQRDSAREQPASGEICHARDCDTTKSTL